MLRLQILKDIAVKSARPTMGNMFVPMEPMHQFFAPDINPQTSIEYLQDLCKSNEPFYVFSYNTFKTLHHDDDCTFTPKMDSMLQISPAELRTQIFFDLVNFYLYTKQYPLAREAVSECRRYLVMAKQEYEMLGKTPKQFVFCHVNEEELEGYLLACGLSAHSASLTEKFHMSQLTQYKVNYGSNYMHLGEENIFL